ncbi:hypothetical protein C7444_11867 [Sphaerotilus hippei]|uniref:Uncharacterized protein n=1 Tax=Sphaerotilus hippei TaxID=744406 RepID=A0A318GVV9_9BURK|nr:hypothetical protein [Sphaerotilus hippei]PXW93698.1 hypothetical protein C7444_11867 [Sphaerotilus hippei]
MTTSTQFAPGRASVSSAVMDSDLEEMLCGVEDQLGALGDALRLRDSHAIEGHAQQLHRALERAVAGFSLAARVGEIPPPLRHRLVKASGQVAAQRETLVRATMALDRAIDILLPEQASAAAPVYNNRVARGLSLYSN